MPSGCRLSGRRDRNRRTALFSCVTFLAWAILGCSLLGPLAPCALGQENSQILTLIFTGRGFEGPPATLREGTIHLAVHNRTFFPDLTLQLDYLAPGATEKPSVVRKMVLSRTLPVWRGTLDMQAGYYTLWVVEYPEWNIRITVGDVPPWADRPRPSPPPRDGNHAPEFTSPSAFSVAGNSVQVGTVAARDFDSADRITGYAITGGADRALFSITNEGVLSFTTVPHYRDPLDTDGRSDDQGHRDARCGLADLAGAGVVR